MIDPRPTAAYLHIPFCHRRCYYCDFPISVVGDRRHGGNFGPIDRYINHLCQEIKQTPAQGLPLATIFLGGGTPSLLTPGQLEQVLTTLQHHIGWAPQPEISIEIDPGTFDRAKIQAYRDLGVNRFSLGVQGFDSTLLHQCGRAHDLEDTYQALGLIQELKLKNWSLDLIAGLPSQTLETWHNSLTEAIRIGPPHLSIYDLTLEPTTVFGKRYQPGESPLPDDQTTAHMYRQSQQRLTQVGYEHYEVSNYAKPGHQCQHNRAYWCNQAYYGFGMGATSYVQGRRFSRPRTTQAYYGWVTSLGQGDWLRDLPETSGFDRLLDTLMLGSRLGEGLSLTELEQAFGSEVVAQVLVAVQPYQACGWVEIDRSGDDRLGNLQGNLRLNDPEGFLFSNTILASLFHHLEINYL